MVVSKLLVVVCVIINLINYIFVAEKPKSKKSGKVAQRSEESYTQEANLNKTTSKVLVVLDDWSIVETHSLFWGQLKNINYDIDFVMVDDPKIKLDYYGERLYHSIVLWIPSFTEEESKDSSISIKQILKHFDAGHNVMVIADKTVGSFIRGLVTEFGVDFDDYDSQVKDSMYLHNYKSSLNQDLIRLRNSDIVVTKNAIPIKNVFHALNGYVLYEGIGLETDPHNHQLFTILKADENTYSVNSEKELFYNVGDKIKLVAAYQGKNNKRVTITGSTSLCSNHFYFLSSPQGDSPLTSPNAQLCQDILNWNFEKTGVLKYENIRHQKLPEGTTMESYRIKDDLEYMIDIFEYDYKTDLWRPYLTDDLQIEFTMMDPFYRVQLKMMAPNKPTYFTSFKVIIYL